MIKVPCVYVTSLDTLADEYKCKTDTYIDWFRLTNINHLLPHILPQERQRALASGHRQGETEHIHKVIHKKIMLSFNYNHGE